MELLPYVTQVRSALAAAAALGDERAREIADGLATAAGPAVQLALVSALSAAADEITAALLDTPGSPGVNVRLAGERAEFELRRPDDSAAPAAVSADDEASARISLRLGEALKTEIEAAARRDAVSVNTWLVRAAAAALASAGGFPPHGGRPRHPSAGSAHRITGWING